MEENINQIMIELGMNPESARNFAWLKEAILLALHNDNWQNEYSEIIGIREGMTRERVSQILYKAVWDNWNKNSKSVLEKHFGSIDFNFEYVKPNHIEFVLLLSAMLRNKYMH